jgi:hypothetical protein
MAWVPAYSRTGMAGIDLWRERYERDVEIINDDRAPSSGMRTGGCESIFANILFILPILAIGVAMNICGTAMSRHIKSTQLNCELNGKNK